MAETGRRVRGGAADLRRWGRVVLAAALAAVAVPAHAAPRGFGEVRLGFMHFDYKEHDPSGAFLDGEKGFVPAIVGEGEVRGDLLFARAMLRYAWGTVNYDGHAQSTDPTIDGLPVQTDSDASFIQGELQAGALVGPGGQVALFGAIGRRHWSRDIQSATILSRTGVPTPISGLSETYDWWELQLGVRWAFLQRRGTSWDVEGRLVQTLSPTISVDLSPFVGAPATSDLDLGEKLGWRFGSTLRQDLGPHGLFLSVNAYVEHYSFGASNVDPVFSIFEPDSRTYNVGLEFGIGGRF